jgi:hypothetical protein
LNKRLDRTLLVVLAAALVVTSMLLRAAPASAELSLYDDFNDPSLLIRSDLWLSSDSYSAGGVGSGRVESVRMIDALLASQLPLIAANTSNPKLLFAKRFVLAPGAGSDSGDVETLGMLKAPNAISIQADITMKICFLGAPGFVQAAVELVAFHDATFPGHEFGDIVAQLRVGCGAGTNQAEITWNVVRCGFGCIGGTSLGTGSFGAATIGQEYRLHVMKSLNRIVFSAGGQTQMFPVPGSLTAPTGGLLNGLRLQIDPLTPSNGGQWALVATVDNVMIDQ